MNIQCPKCREWTEVESGVCAVCGAQLFQSKNDKKDVKSSPFHEREIVDLDALVKAQRHDLIEALKREPDRQILVNGTLTTMREHERLVNRMITIVIVLIFAAIFIAVAILLIAVPSDSPGSRGRIRSRRPIVVDMIIMTPLSNSFGDEAGVGGRK